MEPVTTADLSDLVAGYRESALAYEEKAHHSETPALADARARLSRTLYRVADALETLQCELERAEAAEATV